MSANPNTSLSKQFVQKDFSDAFRHAYPGAFSAVDIYASVTMPDGSVRGIGNLAALSISTHRDTFPVSSMPYVNPRGFTTSHRTIAGTMMFHTIDRNAFGYTAVNANTSKYTVLGGKESGPAHPDELPLFDIHLFYANEEGDASQESLFGVRILDFGKTVSLENLHPIESYSYMALDYSALTVVNSSAGPSPSFLLTRAGNRDPKPVRTGDNLNLNQIFEDTFGEFPSPNS